MTSRSKLSWDIEADADTILVSQAKTYKLVLRGVVVEFARWPHFEQKRKAELIVVAGHRLAVSGLRIEAINDLIVNFG